MVHEFDLKQLAASKKFREVIHRVKQKRDQYILKENGEPQAVLLSFDDFALLEKAKADKEKVWEDLFENLKEVHALNAQFSAEEVDADVDEAIKAVRQAQST